MSLNSSIFEYFWMNSIKQKQVPGAHKEEYLKKKLFLNNIALNPLSSV